MGARLRRERRTDGGQERGPGVEKFIPAGQRG